MPHQLPENLSIDYLFLSDIIYSPITSNSDSPKRKMENTKLHGHYPDQKLVLRSETSIRLAEFQSIEVQFVNMLSYPQYVVSQ